VKVRLLTTDGKEKTDIKGDADTVDSIHAAAAPAANKLLALDANANLVLVGQNYTGIITTINNDAVYSFTPGTSIGALLVVCRSGAGYEGWNGMVSYRTAAVHKTAKMFGHADLDVTVGALAGTTGSDGHMTVSANSGDGKVYIENRVGTALSMSFVVLG